MHIYEYSKIGEFHANHNEDASLTCGIGNELLLIAVLDGCSMGRESHFASTLITKLLRKLAKQISYLDFIHPSKKSLETYLKNLLRDLFEELKTIKNLLQLEVDELLSTLILGIVDLELRDTEIIIIGDGLISCDAQIFEFDQDNKPDYLGYHLNENFEDWWSSHSQRLSFKNMKDLSLATDGIFTFQAFDNQAYPKISEAAILNRLLLDIPNTSSENMLNHQLLELEQEFGLKPSDDLSIIRIIFPNK